jgi:hypothetical protein
MSSTNYTTYGSYMWGVAGDIPVLERPEASDPLALS